jgi:hypothetical protein
LLVFISFALLGWGLIKPERIYQYPFIMGGIFIAFVLPQAFTLINNPSPVTPEGLARVLLMSCLCAAMCWLGYQLPVNVNSLKKINISVDHQKFLIGGVILVFIAYVSQYLILQLPEEVRANTQWTGVITIYAFFRNLIYPGFAILFLSLLQKFSLYKFCLTAIAVGLPLQQIIFQGRREPAAIFLLTIGISLYFIRRYVPSKLLVISVLVCALLAIPLTGSYRSIASSGKWNELRELKPIENIQDFVEGQDKLELKNGALIMDAAVRTGRYGYGTGYWNRLIFRFIPGQLVGHELKKSLFIGSDNYNLQYLYGYRSIVGMTVTGMGDSFVQFDYFGCLFFFFLAHFFKYLWMSAIYHRNLFSQVFYISLVSSAMLSVTHGTTNFLPDLITSLFFIGAVVVFARRKFHITVKPTSQVKSISAKT